MFTVNYYQVLLILTFQQYLAQCWMCVAVGSVGNQVVPQEGSKLEE